MDYCQRMAFLIGITLLQDCLRSGLAVQYKGVSHPIGFCHLADCILITEKIIKREG